MTILQPVSRDGGATGPAGAPAVVPRSRRALRRPPRQPGELGPARACATGATGALDVEGDLGEGRRAVWAAARARGPRPPRRTPADRARALATAVLGVAGPPLLDDTMARSCVHRAGEGPGFTSADAQRAKPELVCRNLALKPGARERAAYPAPAAAPDSHLRPLGEPVGPLKAAGREVRHTRSLREHDVRSGMPTTTHPWDEGLEMP
ncbi:hypothetical protein [Streptomyces griseoruber]|uniref:hypothetical protein n=1 Tax=Streptomyces griseoruber TaxID=1943 RepID=UPI00378EB8A5